MKSRFELIIKIIIIASLILVGGGVLHIPFITNITKFIFAVLIWFTIAYFPYYTLKSNDFNKYGNFLIKLILMLGIYQIFATIFSTSKTYELVGGNKYVTLFFNDACALNFAAPLFAYLATKESVIRDIILWVKRYISLQLLFIPFANLFATCPWYVANIMPYLNKSGKILAFIGIFFTLYFGLFQGARSSLAYLLLCGTAYIVSYVIKNRLINKIFCFTTIILPFILFIPMLIGNSDSIFSELSEKVSLKDEEMTTDTRTFLYLEMKEDLTSTNSWIMGKGAYSHYFSNYFYMSTSDKADFHYRMTSEVGILNFLLHGGLIYVILYYGLFILAIILALYKGKSNFMQCNAAMLSGYFFCSFFACFVGFSFIYMYIFFIIGCCLSRKWRNYSDKEIALLFNY